MMFSAPQIENFFLETKDLIGKFFTNSKSFQLIKTLPKDSKICIACSGGCDSIFLVFLFCTYFKEFTKNASILHLNHNLRGQESDDDAKFVEKLASSLNLNFISGKLKKYNFHQSEDTLRKIRYSFFKNQMDAIGSKILLLGQQKNDIAETLIMRLSRASGLDGLSVPREISQFSSGCLRIRPLLFLKKEEIESILSNIGITWRVDSSNLHCNYFRNTIRHVVLKEIQNAIPQYDIISNFVESHKQIVEANETIEDLTNEYLKSVILEERMDLSKFLHLPTAIIRRILNKWLMHVKIEIKKSEFDKLLENIAPSSKKNIVFNCIGSKKIKLHSNVLCVLNKHEIGTKNTFKFLQWVSGILFLPNQKKIQKKIIPIDQNIFENIKNCNVNTEAYISYDTPKSLNISIFDPLAKYQQFGHNSTKKLKEIIGRDILNYDNIPIISVDHEICWVPGLSVADKFKIKEHTRHALLLTYS